MFVTVIFKASHLTFSQCGIRTISHIYGSELSAHKKSNQILLAARQSISNEMNVNANGRFLQVFQKSSLLAVYLIPRKQRFLCCCLFVFVTRKYMPQLFPSIIFRDLKMRNLLERAEISSTLSSDSCRVRLPPFLPASLFFCYKNVSLEMPARTRFI